MKHDSLKGFILLSIFILLPAFLSAQTILVHSSGEKDLENDELRVYIQSVEAGIMDVLFNQGFIVFSDLSEMDMEEARKMAAKVGSDMLISWSLEPGGIKGTLLKLSQDKPLSLALVGENDLEGLYNDPSEMYSALGSRLCESLVAGNL